MEDICLLALLFITIRGLNQMEHTNKKGWEDHRSAELLKLRADVAELERTIELLKLDNQQLTESLYNLLQRDK